MVKLFGWGQSELESGHAPMQRAASYQSPNDCLLCRLTGSAAFIGLGAYSLWSGMYQINAQKAHIVKSGSRFGIASRKAGIATIAATLCGMGVYRLVK